MYLKNKKEVSPGAGAAAAAKSVTPCYNIGDTGPAGGIIVSIPGVGQNTSNYLYEMALTPAHEATIADTGVDYSCNSALCGGSQQVAGGVELGCWNQNINSQFGTNTSHEFGEGHTNTVNVISGSANTYHFNSSWSNAFSLASSYSFGGYDDWFLPSVEEVKEASDNGFDVNPGGSLIATSSGYNHSAYSSSLINDQYPALPNNKVFFSFKPGAPYIRCVRGKDLTVIPMRRFTCGIPADAGICDGIVSTGSENWWFWPSLSDYSNGTGIILKSIQQIKTEIETAGYLPPGDVVLYVGEIHRFGNKLWALVSAWDPNGVGTTFHGFAEWILDTSVPSPIMTLNRWIDFPALPAGWVTWGYQTFTGGSGIDGNTFVSALHDGNGNWGVYKIDVSSSVAVITNVFYLPVGYPYAPVRDLIHISSTDTYVCAGREVLGNTWPYSQNNYDEVFHFDSSGNILGSVSLTSDGKCYGVCCFNGEILVSSENDMNIYTGFTNNTIHSVDLTNYTMSQVAYNGSEIGGLVGDFATNPECCGAPSPPDPTDPCFYNIGDEGPGGGIIFATPTSMPSQNFYYEVATSDISTSNTGVSEFQTVPGYVNPTYVNTPAFMPGAEWGAYKSLISLSSNPSSTSFGQGYINTPVIANYPQCNGFPCHPLISNNSIAAELCSSYHSGGKNDWFLPSVDEFNEMFFLGGVPQVSPPNNLYQLSGLYWTSSAVYDPSNNQVDAKAWGFDADHIVAHQGYRDKKLSVRAIRRFECSVCPDGNPGCVDYNWVDGGGNADGGCIYNSAGGHPFANDDSVLGGTSGDILLSSEDVLGNHYTPSMFNVGDEIIIKAWRFDYTYFGTWKYTITSSSWWVNPLWCMHQMIYIKYDNVVHLDGPYQYVASNYDDYVNETGPNWGSTTQTFMQIITPGTTNNGLANGTQTTMWGNLPYTGSSYWTQELPYRCTPVVGNQTCTTCRTGHVCMPTYTVNPNYANLVYPNLNDCVNAYNPPSTCCGGVTSAARPPVGYKNQVRQAKYKEPDFIIVSTDQLKNYNPGKGEPCEDCGE